MKVNKLTEKQMNDLRDQIADLTNVKLPAARERLAAAAAHGDLSENAEFDSAKKEIKDIQLHIEMNKEILNTSEVLSDEEFYSTEIRVGSTVKIQIDGEVFEKNIALSTGIDFLKNISPKSALGEALIGKELMDKFRYKDNKGVEHEVLVLDVM